VTLRSLPFNAQFRALTAEAGLHLPFDTVVDCPSTEKLEIIMNEFSGATFQFQAMAVGSSNILQRFKRVGRFSSDGKVYSNASVKPGETVTATTSTKLELAFTKWLTQEVDNADKVLDFLNNRLTVDSLTDSVTNGVNFEVYIHSLLSGKKKPPEKKLDLRLSNVIKRMMEPQKKGFNDEPLDWFYSIRGEPVVRHSQALVNYILEGKYRWIVNADIGSYAEELLAYLNSISANIRADVYDWLDDKEDSVKQRTGLQVRMAERKRIFNRLRSFREEYGYHKDVLCVNYKDGNRIVVTLEALEKG